MLEPLNAFLPLRNFRREALASFIRHVHSPKSTSPHRWVILPLHLLWILLRETFPDSVSISDVGRRDR